MSADLTEKQRRFVHAYLANGRNAAEAYRTAYSTKASAQRVAEEAAKLLRHPKVAPIVEEANRRAAEATERALNRFEVTQERVVSALARLGFYDARDIFTWSETGVRLRPSDEISDDAAAAITEISQTETKDGGTLKVKLADKRAALVDLGKHLGLFTDKHELTGKDGAPLMPEVSDTEAARRIAFLLTKATRETNNG